MYHPLDEGQYWQETHYPEVKILRVQKRIEITLFLAPPLHKKFQLFESKNWTYLCKEAGEWQAYSFYFFLENGTLHAFEIKHLNMLLSFCAFEGSEGNITSDPQQAQLSLVNAENPKEFGMGAYGLWANFSQPVTQKLLELSPHQLTAFEEYTKSHMRGAHKILAPENRLSRIENRMRFYQGDNTLPIFNTFGNCACLSATSNELDYGGGFKLSPHNIDSHTQQFLILIGTLIF